MNCTQCENQETGTPIFPPEPQEPRRANPVFYIFVGTALVFFVILGLIIVADLDDGGDFLLYGKTLDNKDFDWESLRGKYVLVEFTATWCVYCKEELPHLLEAYEKYHEKGLKIVSVYIGEEEPFADVTVRNFVAEEKIPWIILSESLTVAAGLVPQGKHFGIVGIPTLVLVDKNGKVIPGGGANYKQELQKVFGE
jgi:thiol-disulfide isomerase/thioredoxin